MKHVHTATQLSLVCYAMCAGKGTLVLSDALNHSSIVAGIKAGGAKVKVSKFVLEAWPKQS